MMGRRLVAIMTGAPSPRTLTVVSPATHHGQWGRVSFKISGEKRRFLSEAVYHLAIYTTEKTEAVI
jgi:hypothetical protein